MLALALQAARWLRDEEAAGSEPTTRPVHEPDTRPSARPRPGPARCIRGHGTICAMLPPAPAVHPAASRQDSTGRRVACLILAPCWALAGATLGVIVFRAWMQPLPNPATNGPIPNNGPFLALFFGTFMAAPLGALSIPLFVTGTEYLRRTMLTGGLRTAWTIVVRTAAAVEVIFLGIFVNSAFFGLIGPKQYEWVMLVTSAGFIGTGIAMAAVITAASRAARQRAAVP